MSAAKIRNSRLHDKRGNNADRRNRKIWMLETFAPLEDKAKVACVHCKALCSYDEVEADRINPGGSYARYNVQPSCGSCNRARSNNVNWTYQG